MPFLLLGLLAVVWAQGIGRTSPVQTIEGRSLDWRFQFRGPIQWASSPVVLIPIEEGAELPYRSPIPRGHLASIIEKREVKRIAARQDELQDELVRLPKAVEI